MWQWVTENDEKSTFCYEWKFYFFVEKVEIAKILLHNLILSGYLHQIGNISASRGGFYSGKNNNQIPPKATFKSQVHCFSMQVVMNKCFS